MISGRKGKSSVKGKESKDQGLGISPAGKIKFKSKLKMSNKTPSKMGKTKILLEGAYATKAQVSSLVTKFNLLAQERIIRDDPQL